MHGVGLLINIDVSRLGSTLGSGSTLRSTLLDSISCFGARGGLVFCLSGLGGLGGDSRGCGASCGAGIHSLATTRVVCLV